MKIYIALALLVVMSSCKSKAVLAEASADKKISSDKIIEGHYANKKDFSTLYIKAAVDYEDEKQSQHVTAEVRIKRNEMILVSVRFLGITMAKALITPTEVKYYDKINGKFFDGNYSALSQWLGTDLDFQKVQNMLIGQAFDDLTKGKFTTTIEDKLYKLEDRSDANTAKTYSFEAERFLLKKQQIEQKAQQRAVVVFYPNYAETAQILLPTGLLIDAAQEKGKTSIKVDYNNASFNEELSFPYSVPDGYERIFIN
jgi:hypothetical protein